MFTGLTTTIGTGRFMVQPLEWGEPLERFFVEYDTLFYRVGDRFHQWENGVGTYLGEGLITRDTIFESSESNNKVNFACGTKIVHLVKNSKWPKDMPTFSDDEIDAGARALFYHMQPAGADWLSAADFSHAFYRAQVAAVLKGITEHRRCK